MKRLAIVVALTSLVGVLVGVQPAWAAPTLEVTPETQSVAQETIVTFTATVTPAQAGLDIDFELFGSSPNDPDDAFKAPADLECITSSEGKCTVSYQDAAAKVDERDTLRAWIDDDGVDNTIEGDRGEQRDERLPGDLGAGNTPEPDNTDVVSATWVAAEPGVDTEPEELLALKQHDVNLTTTVAGSNGKPREGVTVDFVIESGPGANPQPRTCKTEQNGSCTVKIPGQNPTGPAPDTSIIRSWLDDDAPDQAEGRNEKTDPGAFDEPDTTDVVSIKWVSEVNVLDVEPETSSPRIGGTQTLNATVQNNVGQPIEDRNVDFIVRSGPNRGDHIECTTDASGTCAVSYSSSAAGADLLLGWIDANTDDFTDEGDLNEGRNETATPGATEPDRTDVVVVKWTAFCPGHRDDPRNQVVGTDKDNTLKGTAQADVICGKGGADLLIGRGGNDVIFGGGGDDVAKGGNGNDRVSGNGGDDDLYGNLGNDILKGGTGRDDLFGGAGSDACAEGPGAGTESGCEA